MACLVAIQLFKFMGPISRHLRVLFPELPPMGDNAARHWTFDVSLNALGPEVYSKLLPIHPLLDLEYSILCNELHHDFLTIEHANKQQLYLRLTSALMFCELLEHLHQHYLDVPIEVVRLRHEQRVFRGLLRELAGFSFESTLLEKEEVKAGLSFSQQIKSLTFQANWYRVLVNRSKRVINLLDGVLKESPGFNKWVRGLDKIANPVLAYFGLFFHVPRSLTNSFLLVKHTVPGPWMNAKEAALPWFTRFYSQWLRQWFEQANDNVWIVVSALNLFVFIGASLSAAVYLSTAAFAFDVFNAATRAYIELKRLYTLRQEYEQLLVKEQNTEYQEVIKNHIKHIKIRINFEQMRFALHVVGNILICAAMALALPFLAVNPVGLLASAVFLVLLWGITFELTRRLNNARPKEHINVPTNVSKLGFFAAKESDKKLSENQPSLDLDVEEGMLSPY